MQNVATDMIRMESDSAVRRPTLSPMWPQTNPPSGRTKNEIANTREGRSSPVWRSDSGKKTVEMVTAR